MRNARWIPVLLSLGACAVVRLPPHAAASRFGTVRAADPETAEEYARVLDDVAPVVSRALPDLTLRPVDLRVVARISEVFEAAPPVEFTGARFDGDLGTWIEIVAAVEPSERPRIVAHELVHHWLGEAWSTLPPAIEDGLANVIARAIDDEGTSRTRLHAFLRAWMTLNGELTVDRNAMPAERGQEGFTVTIRSRIDRLEPADLLDAMRRDLNGYFAIEGSNRFAVVTILSELLVSRLSIDRLFEMCVTAKEQELERVPAEWIFEAIRFDPLDRGSWNELLLATYGLNERTTLMSEAPVPWATAIDGRVTTSINLVRTITFF